MHTSFHASGFFVLRTPLLPLDAWRRWGDGLEAASADAPNLAGALARDRALLLARLATLFADPVLREAIFVASPSLDEGLRAWLEDRGAARARDVPLAITRYFARMACRPTPFGIFSGITTGQIGDATDLRLAPAATYRRNARLDVHYLTDLADALAAEPEVRDVLTVSPNNALHRVGDTLRYPEAYTQQDTKSRAFRLVSVQRTEYLDATLERAAGGAPLRALAHALVDDDVDLADARAYVDELLATRVLTHDLAPAVTGDDPLSAAIDALRAMGVSSRAAPLDAVRARLSELNSQPLGAAAAQYACVAEALGALPATPAVAHRLRVDLQKPSAQATLGAEVLAEITRGVEVLRRIGDATEPPSLRAFRAAFEERYGDREVPLLEALDDERGVGFPRQSTAALDPAPLLDGLAFPEPEPEGRRFEKRDAVKLSAVLSAAREGRVEWSLTDDDVARLASPDPAPLPDAFDVMTSVDAASPDAVRRGEFLVHVYGSSGPSGANLLGRFCEGDSTLLRLVRAHLAEEEALRPEAIFAEIAHLPDGRLGNILCRPVLRGWEIPYGGRSSVPAERQIMASDLRVSVRDGRVIVRSASLDREVVPRLTTAHNFAPAELNVYRFLASVPRAPGAPRWWSWGALGEAPFLPRVRFGRCVLAPARWRLTEADDLRPVLTARTDEARFEAVGALRARLSLPRRVALAESDQLLPVDLENILSIDAFIAVARSQPAVTLVELPPQGGVAHGPEGVFAHELIVPFVRERASAPPPPVVASDAAAPRRFIVGSEWLYLRVYCGVATSDRVLTAALRPIVQEARAAGRLAGWFFIRYADPHYHLRLRLRGDPAWLTAVCLPALHRALAPFVERGDVWRVDVGTYEREVERYGGPAAMPLSEAIFDADSAAAVDALRDADAAMIASARPRWALYAIHGLLLDLGLTLAERLALMTATRASFAREHRVTTDFERQLGVKFRADRLALESVLSGDREALRGARPVFDARAAALAPACAALRGAVASGQASRSLSDLAVSHVHMVANRWLRSEQRAQELVLYDQLARLYEGERARSIAARAPTRRSSSEV